MSSLENIMKINKRNFLKTTFSIFCAPFVINSENFDNKKYIKIIIRIPEDLYTIHKTHFCYLEKDKIDYFIKSRGILSDLSAIHWADCVLNVYDNRVVKDRFDRGVKWYEDRVINTIDTTL